MKFNNRGTVLAAGSWDHTVRTWDLLGSGLKESLSHPAEIVSLDWRRDGEELIAACMNGSIYVWEPKDGNFYLIYVNSLQNNKVELNEKNRGFVCSAFLLKGGKEIKLYLPIAETTKQLMNLIERHDKTQLSDGERTYNVNYKEIEALIIN